MVSSADTATVFTAATCERVLTPVIFVTQSKFSPVGVRAATKIVVESSVSVTDVLGPVGKVATPLN